MNEREREILVEVGWGGGRGGENEWKEGLRRVEGRSSQKKQLME
jgi:hypothetical protein